MVNNICNQIKLKENRIVINWDDFDSNPNSLNACSINNILKNKDNTTLRDYLKSIGFELQKSGRGSMHIFEDGELTSSKFEYNFTKYLREKLNLKYNIDYYRNIRYSTFINGYNKTMNCDYKILYNNKIIYIEIAGLLRDYKKYYYNNQQIVSSKSKEKYRNKLMIKEQMLKENNLKYLILFPEDLSIENLNNIFDSI